MFKKSIVSAFILAAGLVSAQANAAFVATDWKSGGDTLATLDTNTGLEWLDLSQTMGKSLSDVTSLLSTTYKGWRLPTVAEITKLAQSIVPHFVGEELNWDGYLQDSKSPITNEVQALFGGTLGLYKTPQWGNVKVFGVNYGLLFNTLTSEFVPTFASKTYGVYLVSDGGTTLSSINNPMLNINNPNAPIHHVPDVPADVPVHAGFGMLGLLLMAFGLRRHKSA